MLIFSKPKHNLSNKKLWMCAPAASAREKAATRSLQKREGRPRKPTGFRGFRGRPSARARARARALSVEAKRYFSILKNQTISNFAATIINKLKIQNIFFENECKNQEKIEFRLQFCRSQDPPVFPPSHTVEELHDAQYLKQMNLKRQRKT